MLIIETQFQLAERNSYYATVFDWRILSLLSHVLIGWKEFCHCEAMFGLAEDISQYVSHILIGWMELCHCETVLIG